MTNPSPVTDKEAVAIEWLGHAFRNIALPHMSRDDLGEVAEALRRFRVAAAEQERVRVAEWLRGEAEWMTRDEGQMVCDLAIAIEAGDMEP
jgi:hypothetical protein